MLSREQLEKYLSLCMSSEADFAEIYEENEVSETISMLSGKVENVNTVVVSGIGIRLYKDVQSVYAYSNESDEASVIPLINDLKGAIGRSDKEASVKLERVEYENRHPVEIDFEKTPLSEKTDLLKRANDAAFASDDRIVKVQG